ncbi:hypothetical protein KOR42_32190 [Thalassoglobus neptunius]|uniref:Uncharacterized protein n=1 Tax=Thalassoglobus neptunius TaxID=1938619 RepID=A0A5C5WMT8_9PLAN|nr:hypothetical protein [Thalassoglobus neptunius]TWT51937.1 hypothetical protein KOR42_32190 [Thalassoglobus neptunius]
MSRGIQIDSKHLRKLGDFSCAAQRAKFARELCEFYRRIDYVMEEQEDTKIYPKEEFLGDIRMTLMALLQKVDGLHPNGGQEP